MARVKISEYCAKSSLLTGYLGLASSATTTSREIKQIFHDTNLVVKVDEGIKKRGKLGLVKVNVTSSQIPPIIKSWSALGWSNFLIEPVIEHAQDAEHYLALERVRGGWQISYSENGGIEVENSWSQVRSVIVPNSSDLSGISTLNPVKGKINSELSALTRFLHNTIPILDKYHISFVEMNPILIRGNKLIPLDMACEVDSTGSPLLGVPDKTISRTELEVAKLDASTPASLKFKLLNERGSIWVFLSGGGASLVIADEVADQGMGKNLANYGEYSGAPTDDDVYAYAKIILSQLLKSSVSPKAIIIAGGVANFTDVASTFRGLIHALGEKKAALSKAKVKVFVRRGGPNEENGLKLMHDFLKESKLLGSVHGHETPLTAVVSEVKEYLK